MRVPSGAFLGKCPTSSCRALRTTLLNIVPSYRRLAEDPLSQNFCARVFFKKKYDFIFVIYLNLKVPMRIGGNKFRTPILVGGALEL